MSGISGMSGFSRAAEEMFARTPSTSHVHYKVPEEKGVFVPAEPFVTGRDKGDLAKLMRAFDAISGGFPERRVTQMEENPQRLNLLG